MRQFRTCTCSEGLNAIQLVAATTVNRRFSIGMGRDLELVERIYASIETHTD